MRYASSVQHLAMLQIDVSGSSRAYVDALDRVEYARAWAAFADGTTQVATRHGLRRLFWAGDGALFVANRDGPYDFLVETALEMGRFFESWRSADASRQFLELRTSAHVAEGVQTAPTSGYYLSSDLNAFIKHERTMSLAGWLAITHPVRVHLDKTAHHFTPELRRSLRIEVDKGRVLEDIYYTRAYKEKSPFKRTFPQWLATFGENAYTQSSDPLVGPVGAVCARLSDAIFLQTISTSAADFVIQIEPTPKPRPLFYRDLGLAGNALLDDVAKRQRTTDQRSGYKEDALKVAPIRAIRPMIDFPVLTISWHSEVFSRARALHHMLTGSKRFRIDRQASLWTTLATRAADIQGESRQYPGILCAHIVVRPADHDRRILLCQRQVKGRAGAYDEGQWSCSIEEQFLPSESVEDCVRRGVAEELLGEGSRSEVSVKALALILESRILNWAIIAVAELPYTFDEIWDRWRRGLPRDKSEHRQICAIPLQEDIFVALAQGNGELTPKIRDHLVRGDSKCFARTTSWSLHPTSLARFASALWYSEEGASNPSETGS